MPRKQANRGYSARKVDTREIRQRFLIVCEGKKTEPNYFESFRVPIVVIKVQGLEKSPIQLLKKAQEEKQKDDYDQVWCIFDRDRWEEEEFDKTIKSADTEEIQVAYSNEAFELWYLLHYEFINTGISRSQYEQKLTRLLGSEYQKNCNDMYEKLVGKQEKAIANAEKLLSQYNPCNPAKDNPSTTVHLLVKQLNRFIR